MAGGEEHVRISQKPVSLADYINGFRICFKTLLIAQTCWFSAQNSIHVNPYRRKGGDSHAARVPGHGGDVQGTLGVTYGSP